MEHGYVVRQDNLQITSFGRSGRRLRRSEERETKVQ